MLTGKTQTSRIRRLFLSNIAYFTDRLAFFGQNRILFGHVDFFHEVAYSSDTLNFSGRFAFFPTHGIFLAKIVEIFGQDRTLIGHVDFFGLNRRYHGYFCPFQLEQHISRIRTMTFFWVDLRRCIRLFIRLSLSQWAWFRRPFLGVSSTPIVTSCAGVSNKLDPLGVKSLRPSRSMVYLATWGIPCAKFLVKNP